MYWLLVCMDVKTLWNILKQWCIDNTAVRCICYECCFSRDSFWCTSSPTEFVLQLLAVHVSAVPQRSLYVVFGSTSLMPLWLFTLCFIFLFNTCSGPQISAVSLIMTACLCVSLLPFCLCSLCVKKICSIFGNNPHKVMMVFPAGRKYQNGGSYNCLCL